MVQESHHDHVEGLGISCDLCDPECNGACEIKSIIPPEDREKSYLVEEKAINDHEHIHDHEHTHNHEHHHNIYPNSKHPLGPVTLRLLKEDQILRNSVEKE